jgi:hypothetical protein
MAITYESEGRMEEAAAAFDQVLALAPNDGVRVRRDTLLPPIHDSRLGGVGVGLGRSFIGAPRRPGSARAQQGVPESELRARLVGAQVRGPLASGNGALAVAHGREHTGQVGMKGGELGVDLDRASDQANRFLRRALVVACEAEQMQGVGVVGLGLQDIPADRRRLVVASRLLALDGEPQRLGDGHGARAFLTARAMSGGFH